MIPTTSVSLNAPIERCRICGYPKSRNPVIMWDQETNTCGGCINYAKRHNVDWGERRAELMAICDTYRSRKPYNVLIPVSGGKDSHFLVYKMVEEYDMSPLLFTVTDSFSHTEAGVHNLHNLLHRYKLNHYTYTINHDLFIRATRYCFEQTGRPLDFVELAIYTMPVYIAFMLDIPLVVFGENSDYEYGYLEHNFYTANEKIRSMAQREYERQTFWQEGGVGFNELRSIAKITGDTPLVIYMSYFEPWSSTTHYQIAKSRGFVDLNDTGEWNRQGTMEQFEQIDSYGYLCHLWMRYPRMGFQRTTDIAVRRVREGKLSREKAIEIIQERDHILDYKAKEDFIRTLGYTEGQFYNIIENAKWNKYYNK